MYYEMHQVEDLISHLNTCGSLDRVVCQGLDLRPYSALLASYTAEGAAFLGCHFEEAVLYHIHVTGGLVFPRLPDLPYRPYRAHLYTSAELMSGYVPGKSGSYFVDTLDAVIYRHARSFRATEAPLPILEALAQRLHDHAIDDALHDLLRHHAEVVAIMGGHAMRRGETAYRDVAWMARALTRAGMFVATGGGPGAMEAGNLGAWLAPYGDEALDRALHVLTPVPLYDDDAYFDTAYQVLERFPEGARSLAIPTWFYGHEPPNQFASHIAKYFANSIREDGLLALATRGVIYAPGSAGTIQEVFMDAAQNHYGSFGWVSPMVFYNRTYWTSDKPVYPLLRHLARTRSYAPLLAAEDRPEDVVRFLLDHPPVRSTDG